MPDYLGTARKGTVHIYDKGTQGVLCGKEDFLFFEPFCWGHLASCPDCKAVFANMLDVTQFENASVFHQEVI